ncbi:Store-operated calcium entry-associated regulatory factor [Chionoecetes opilio]|uniref:Store-operated calcium entry-associated regulatory factor n=1 Tax=Chionoecetes opilio TaxID=41210 RepID=A0A8J4YL28_CHIOP|nr:Store-operated calcium entry-associated regulatory factor [Chionoecetes opilio]
MEMRGPMLAVWGVVAILCHGSVEAGGDSVYLKTLEVLTLYSGKMTKGRRSSPVSQLECVSGGTAPCDAFRPRVVQCYNRGWDGEGVQWECKTDMDNAYRFGSIEVSCEGYEHRDDPYVLSGSCGLQYTIDYSKEGHNNQHKHNYYGESYNTRKNEKQSSYMADFIVLIAVGLMLWVFYKTCIAPRQTREDAGSTTGDDYPAGGGGGGYGWFGGGGGTRPTAPPPPPHHNAGYDDASCRNRASGGGGTGGGGFWTGAAAGGLLGYMFGGNRAGRNYTSYGGGYGGGGNSGWSWGGGGGGGGFGGSSGTRSASGFGGTSRR